MDLAEDPDTVQPPSGTTKSSNVCAYCVSDVCQFDIAGMATFQSPLYQPTIPDGRPCARTGVRGIDTATSAAAKRIPIDIACH